MLVEIQYALLSTEAWGNGSGSTRMQQDKIIEWIQSKNLEGKVVAITKITPVKTGAKP